jgi:hypothetical protein
MGTRLAVQQQCFFMYYPSNAETGIHGAVRAL